MFSLAAQRLTKLDFSEKNSAISRRTGIAIIIVVWLLLSVIIAAQRYLDSVQSSVPDNVVRQ